jgi:hypothetical protein
MVAVPPAEALAVEVEALRAEVRALHRGRDGLERGRAIAIADAKKRGAYSRVLVASLAHADQLAGRPRRGRAKRVALTLGGQLSESQVGKLLRELSNVRG